MDKYQEALNNVRKVYVESEHYDEEDIRLLQELVEKETPMKPEKMIRGRSGNIKYKSTQYHCPNCNFEISKSYHSVFTPNKNNYCPNCGKHIDWSDKEC